MPNSNRIAGLDCPKRNQEGRSNINDSSLSEVTDDETETTGTHKWGNRANVASPQCDHQSSPQDFRTKPTIREAMEHIQDALFGSRNQEGCDSTRDHHQVTQQDVERMMAMLSKIGYGRYDKRPTKWECDEIQFARYIEEIQAVGLTREQRQGLCDSMNLGPNELAEIEKRAERTYERSITTHVTIASSHNRGRGWPKRCQECGVLVTHDNHCWSTEDGAVMLCQSCWANENEDD